MTALTQTRSFRFMTSVESVQLTGIKASSLAELDSGLREVDGSSIYYHTHHFYRTHSFLGSADRSDFALWVSHNLNEALVAEKMDALDLRDFTTIHELGEAVLATMQFLKSDADRWNRRVPPGLEFFFCKAVSLSMPTRHEARNLEEFLHALERIDIASLYYHLIESPIHHYDEPRRFNNDISQWLFENLGLEKQAEAIAAIDPYRADLETLRRDLLTVLGKDRIRVAVQNAVDRLHREPVGQAAADWLKRWRKGE